MKLTKSIKIYFVLVLTLALFSALHIFLPQGSIIGQFELPASGPIVATATFFMILILYGGFGLIGLFLSKKLGFAEIWDTKVTHKQRFLIPALTGIGIGFFFILTDVVLAPFHSSGALPHPPFPTSIVASITAGIGEEIMFRLFFISFWVWLVSFILFKKKWQHQIFWIVAVFSALIFSFAHIPSVMTILGLPSVHEVPIPLMAEIVILNGTLSLFAANYFRKYGFLAAVGIHFWTDIIWHVLYGFI